MIYIIFVLIFAVFIYVLRNNICVLKKALKQGQVLLGKCESVEEIFVVNTTSYYRCIFFVSHDDKSKNIQIDCHWRPHKGKNYSIIYDEKRNKYILKNDYLLIFILVQLMVIIMLFIFILQTALLIKYR